MSSQSLVNVNNISKVYKLYDAPIDRLKETFHPFKRKYHRKFIALEDVTFSAEKGDVVGIIGKNGSGKSTLLQIITGVLSPSSGSVEVNGKISALLELGGGFNPELSGLENVYFKSSLLGFSKKETDSVIGDILSFADIGDFVHQAVKTYSSGMFVRLAFAVAINVNPEILIIDEALSVGDFRFKQKCLRKIESFRDAGKTIFFVSHDTGSVLTFCNRAIWLVDGKIQEMGKPDSVCKNYIAYMSYDEVPNKLGEDSDLKEKQRLGGGAVIENKNESISWVDIAKIKHSTSFGQKGAEIKKVCFYSKKDKKTISIFKGGERVIFGIQIMINRDLKHPIVGFHLVTPKGFHILGMNNDVLGIELGMFHAGETKIVTFEFDFPLLKHDVYTFSPAVADGIQEEHINHHWVHDAYVVEIANKDLIANIGNQIVLQDNIDIMVS